MTHQFIKVYVVRSGDGYTSTPVAYFSSKLQAEMWMKSQKDSSYLDIAKDTVEAIQVGDKTWLLGRAVDLDHKEERERERLINSARDKLSAEELAALLGK